MKKLPLLMIATFAIVGCSKYGPVSSRVPVDRNNPGYVDQSALNEQRRQDDIRRRPWVTTPVERRADIENHCLELYEDQGYPMVRECYDNILMRTEEP